MIGLLLNNLRNDKLKFKTIIKSIIKTIKARSDLAGADLIATNLTLLQTFPTVGQPAINQMPLLY